MQLKTTNEVPLVFLLLFPPFKVMCQSASFQGWPWSLGCWEGLKERGGGEPGNPLLWKCLSEVLSGSCCLTAACKKKSCLHPLHSIAWNAWESLCATACLFPPLFLNEVQVSGLHLKPLSFQKLLIISRIPVKVLCIIYVMFWIHLQQLAFSFVKLHNFILLFIL